jgi:hypothetical protein
MTKSSDDEKKQIEQTKAIMAKLASMPHKPHVAKRGGKTNSAAAPKTTKNPRKINYLPRGEK